MLARQLWPNRSAIGQKFLIGQGIPQGRASVVGVVRHVKLRSLVDALTPQIFIPFALWSRNPMAFVVSTDGDPMALAADIRTAMRALDPNAAIYDVRSMQVYVESARATRRFTVLLAVVFALSALLLTSVGVYGVLACVVVYRRQEFGVRRALGADPAQVMHEVVRECARFAAVGCMGGLGAAALSAELLRNQLYGVDARDPLTYVAGLAVILAGAALASWIPVRRALAISPMDALRAP
jgi:putative ABC transport system permease protein